MTILPILTPTAKEPVRRKLSTTQPVDPNPLTENILVNIDGLKNALSVTQKPGFSGVKTQKSDRGINGDRIIAKIELLQNNLSGDVKKLTNFTPEYRLRIGDYRVLFEIEGNQVIIYRI